MACGLLGILIIAVAVAVCGICAQNTRAPGADTKLCDPTALDSACVVAIIGCSIIAFAAFIALGSLIPK